MLSVGHRELGSNLDVITPPEEPIVEQLDDFALDEASNSNTAFQNYDEDENISEINEPSTFVSE